jgi:NADH-ubiquinone oxidoreductase chain 1
MLVLWIFLFLGIIISVAFVTLFERKVLGYVQYRLGPNRTYYSGIFQAFSDALRLFIKEGYFLRRGNLLVYIGGPFAGLVLLLVVWFIVPYYINLLDINLGLCFLIRVLALGVYPLLMRRWSSNSKYSFIGGIRGVAQSVSYEVRLVLLLIRFFLLAGGLGLMVFIRCQYYIWFFFFSRLTF